MKDMNIREKYMKIKWVEFENLETGLKIERVNFFNDVTLLVGLSGAGKTQILHAIEYSLKLALGKVFYFHPYKVCLGILINEHLYEWSYTLQKQKKPSVFSFESAEEYFFVNEYLSCDRKNVFIRTSDNVEIKDFTNIPTPKRDKSLIDQYSDDSHFNELVTGLKNLYNIDMDMDVRKYLETDSVNDFKTKINNTFKRKSKINIRTFSHLPTPLKLYLAKIHYSDIYNQIASTINDIFPEIEDIDMVEDTDRDYYCVQISVYNKKIFQRDISNGMLKTIYFIIELYTAAENSLIMIDEFENGLGINCVDFITSLLLEERSDIQFIITSHNPKIIDNIDYTSWRIIERNKNIIHNYDCNSPGYAFDNRHDAYYNLVNKWSYEGKLR